MKSFNNSTNNETTRSNVAKFYSNSSVLITGGTGFLGKVLIEKLLRSCPDLQAIYILIRSKKNKQPEERFKELFDEPLFDLVRQDNDNLLRKVRMVEGDVTKKHLGMSDDDLITVREQVSIVFHVAATIKFDEPLKVAVNINVIGTKNVIELCRKISQLAAVVHVSTAYANCDRDEIDEHIYPLKMDPENLIEISNMLDRDTFQELKHKLLASRPNTYTYTKALAEWYLFKTARDLPVVVCRPSIVTASWKEPFAGWIDNINGPTGVILGTGKGLIRSMFAEPNFVADLIPVDLVTNQIILLAWFATSYQNHKQLSDVSLAVSVTESDSLLADGDSLDEYRSSPLDAELNQEGIKNNYHLSKYEANGVKNGKAGVAEDLRQDKRDKGISSPARRQDHMSQVLSLDDGYGSTNQSSDSKHLKYSLSISFENTTRGLVGKTHEDKNEEAYNINENLRYNPQQSVSKDLIVCDYKLEQFCQKMRLKLAAKNLPEEIADVPVFHCTSGGENPITWGKIQLLVVALLALFPSITTYRYPCGTFTNNKRLDKLFRLTLHYIPGYMMDSISRLFCRNTKLVKLYGNFDQAANLLAPFTSKQWKFSCENSRLLVDEIISEEDKSLFNCDISSLNWSKYLSDYVLGMRKFILKEPFSNLTEARRNLNVVYYRNLFLQICSTLPLLGFAYYVKSCFTSQLQK